MKNGVLTNEGGGTN